MEKETKSVTSAGETVDAEKKIPILFVIDSSDGVSEYLDFDDRDDNGNPKWKKIY